MKLIRTTPAQEILESFCEHYSHRNLDQVLELFTLNANIWGTAENEYIIGREGMKKQLEREWLQAEKSEIFIQSFVPAADTIWAAAICEARITLQGKEHIFDHLRGTVIIEKEAGVWRIAHMHSSFPDYRNPENNSFPIKP